MQGAGDTGQGRTAPEARAVPAVHPRATRTDTDASHRTTAPTRVDPPGASTTRPRHGADRKSSSPAFVTRLRPVSQSVSPSDRQGPQRGPTPRNVHRQLGPLGPIGRCPSGPITTAPRRAPLPWAPPPPPQPRAGRVAAGAAAGGGRCAPGSIARTARGCARRSTGGAAPPPSRRHRAPAGRTAIAAAGPGFEGHARERQAIITVETIEARLRTRH